LDFEFIVKIIPQLIAATKHTISLAILSLVISLTLAIIISSIIYYNVKIITPILKVYVSFFRGTPALCQLYLIYFGLGNMGIPFFAKMTGYTAVVIALSLNMSAYMAENLRGALSSVEKGQSEAGISIGMSSLQIFSLVVFPQAFRVAVPSLSNSFVDLVKGSSMAFTIGVAELMASANMAGIATYNFFEAFFVAAIIYWIITICINFLQKMLEKRLNRAY
jgi:putative amino-acid transport system permease protein